MHYLYSIRTTPCVSELTLDHWADRVKGGAFGATDFPRENNSYNYVSLTTAQAFRKCVFSGSA